MPGPCSTLCTIMSCGCCIRYCGDDLITVLCDDHSSLIDQCYPITPPLLIRQQAICLLPVPSTPPPKDLTVYGVEPNPGPAPLAASALGAIAATAANAIAKTVKKKAKAKKKKRASTMLNNSNSVFSSSYSPATSSLVTAPANMGSVRRGPTYRPVNFSMPFDGTNLQFNMGASLTDAGHLTDGVVSSANQGLGLVGTSIIPWGDSLTPPAAILQCLGPLASSVAQFFAKWRIVQLFVEWIPFVSTATNGCVTIGIIPDPNTQGAAVLTNFNSVSSITDSITTPIWQYCRVDMTRRLDTDSSGIAWKYTDRQVSGTTAIEVSLERGEAVGQLQFASAGVTLGAGSGATFGAIKLSGLLQFKDFAQTSTY